MHVLRETRVLGPACYRCPLLSRRNAALIGRGETPRRAGNEQVVRVTEKLGFVGQDSARSAVSHPTG